MQPLSDYGATPDGFEAPLNLISEQVVVSDGAGGVVAANRGLAVLPGVESGARVGTLLPSLVNLDSTGQVWSESAAIARGGRRQEGSAR